MTALVALLPGLLAALAVSAGMSRAPSAVAVVRPVTASRPRGAPVSTHHATVWAVAVLATVVFVRAGPFVTAVLACAVVSAERSRRRAVRRRRERCIDESVEPVLQELARGLRAGLAPGPALADALAGHARPNGPPLPAAAGTAELDRVLDAWRRTDVTPLVQEAAAQLAVGRPLGGLRADYVLTVATALGVRRQLADEIAAQSSQARASAVVMTVAPLLFFVLLVLTDERASHLMLRTPIGSVLLAAGLGLDAIAFVWMRRITAAVAGPP